MAISSNPDVSGKFFDVVPVNTAMTVATSITIIFFVAQFVVEKSLTTIRILKTAFMMLSIAIVKFSDFQCRAPEETPPVIVQAIYVYPAITFLMRLFMIYTQKGVAIDKETITPILDQSVYLSSFGLAYVLSDGGYSCEKQLGAPILWSIGLFIKTLGFML
jgi:hypothetical protein